MDSLFHRKVTMETFLLGTRKLCYHLFDTTGVQLIPYLTYPWSSRMPSSVPVVTFHSSKALGRVSAIAGQHKGHFSPSLPCLSCAPHSTEGYSILLTKTPRSQKSRGKRAGRNGSLLSPFYFRYRL